MLVDMTDVEEYRLTKDQALAINDQIKSTIQELEDLLSEFISGEGWLALGYQTAWDWWKTEVGERRLGSSTRKVLALQFSKEDVSIKSVAKALGVQRGTIREDVRATSGNSATEHESTPIEPDEILPAQSAEELHAQLQDLLLQSKSADTVPYDITPDKAILYDMDLLNRHMQLAVDVSKNDLSPNVRAKVRIELQILRDMIDLIEERL